MSVTAQFHRLPLAGYSIISTTTSALSSLLQSRLIVAQKTILLFANTNFALKCQALRPWLNSPEVIIVNDGIGLDIAALITHGSRYIENLNGTDFCPYLLMNLSASHKLFLYGGKPGVAQKASAAISRQFGSDIVGYLDGYTNKSPVEVRQLINRSGAEIVLVALGNPIQEEWIYKNRESLDATIFIGVGALFDFLSGGVQRAPKWIQKIHCEWLFRLYKEPRRLVRRYTLDVVSFLILCIRFRVSDKMS
jgi:beta-1,4-glucosyltransferase